jgi:tRNA (guanine-N7-)-methyltransferase
MDSHPPTAIITPASWTEVLPLNHVFPVDGGEATPEAEQTPRPLAVDIGCGKGRFLLTMAARHPRTDFLGVERQLSRLRIVDRRIARAGLRNVRLLRVEAAYAIRYLLPPHSVETFTIFFPDPWPKRRHSQRRLFTAAFVTNLLRAMRAGGCVHLATDHTDYFQSMLKLFRENPACEEGPVFIPDESTRTDFEVLFLRLGSTIHRASFRKR